MTREEKYDAVNQTESLEQLSKVVLSLGNAIGMIEGRNSLHSASRMAADCAKFHNRTPNTLTREFGIRQQALMLLTQGKHSKS